MHGYNDFTWVPPSKLALLSLGTIPWRYYLETKVLFADNKFRGVVRPVIDNGMADPPRGPLHVISATQPGSDPEHRHNSIRLALLDSELRDSGLVTMKAVGSSFDGKHQEDSLAVFGLDDSRARRLGRRFGQVAVFSWAGPTWSLLACASPRRTDRPWRWTESEQ
jgi:hypothetical protein